MEVHEYRWGAHGAQHEGDGIEDGSPVVGAHSSAEAGVEVEVDGHSSCSSRSSQRTEGEVQNLEA